MTYHCQKLISHKFCASEKISNFHTVRKKEEWAKNEEETFYFFRKDSVGENDTSRVIDLFFQKSNVIYVKKIFLLLLVEIIIQRHSMIFFQMFFQCYFHCKTFSTKVANMILRFILII